MSFLENMERNTEEDNFLVTMNIKLRNYQMTLIDCAKRQNSILLLPAGAGKTLIAIHVLCSKTAEITGEFPDRGKRAFFVAPTRVLVTQLHKILSIHTRFRVKLFLGDKAIDSWSKEQWHEQLKINQVIVLTGEILRQILELKYILPSQISLIVFDECHHAISQHPFNVILQQISQEPMESAPLLLGLSAVLLNANPKKKDVQNMIAKMKNSFRGIILTSDLNDLISFAVKPKEKFVPYAPSPALPEEFAPFYDETIYYLNEIELIPPDKQPIPESSRHYKNPNRARKFKNWFVNAKEILQECGIYCGSLAALYYIILVEKTRLMTTDNLEMNVLVYCRTALYKIRKVLLSSMGGDTYSNIYKFSTDKIQTFLSLLLNIKEDNEHKDLSTLIFVRRKVTAVTIATMLKKLRDIDSSFSFLRPEFIIGTNVLDKETLMHELSNDQIVKEFACQNLNTLVSTSLLEEGIDIKSCNVVMNFDFPVSYASYFQTKGRTRQKEGNYYVLVDEKEFHKKRIVINDYRQIEEELYRIISKDSENQEIFFDNRQMYLDLDDEEDDMTSLAILAVYRYCSKLPQDKYSFLAPIAWYVEVEGGKQASVQLPINSPLQEIVEGGVFPNAKQAKKSAFLETLNKLKEIGELDENCNPASFGAKMVCFDYLFPHFIDETLDKNAPLPGTKKRKQLYKMKFADILSNCLPQPGEKVYLHVIDFTVELENVDRPDKTKLQEVLQCPVTFAILSSKKMFKICPFEMYLDLAKVDCNLLINYDEIILTKDELEDIKLCHLAVFNKVLKNMKSFQIFDNRNKGHSFYVAPVCKNELGQFILDWDVINSDFCRDNKLAIVTYNPTRGRYMRRDIEFTNSQEANLVQTSTALVPLSDVENRNFYLANAARNESNQRLQFVMSEAAYKNFIIYPNYRNFNAQVYMVSEVCYNLTPLSPFPNSTYPDYYSYYQDKYMLEISNINQPLIKVAPVFNCCNFNKPRIKEKPKKKKLNKLYEELFIPELCDIVLFDKRYWLKALLLPSALNRLCHLYHMEEFRRKIIQDTGLGVVELPADTEWNSLKADHTLKKDENEVEEEDPVALDMFLPLSQLRLENKRNSAFYMEIKRNILDVGVCDLEYMVSFLESFDTGEKRGFLLESQIDAEIMAREKLKSFVIPKLEILVKMKDNAGPNLSLLAQALTCSSANDSVNNERLEILGDSFLKFAVATFLFRNFDRNEGVLATLKSKMVGNRNLFYCGLAKGFQDVLSIADFSPMFDWNPPLLCLPEELVEDVISNNTDPSVIYDWEIPVNERFSGDLSDETLSKNKEVIMGYDKTFGEGLNGFFPYKMIPDKSISDSVEAIIGVYLMEFGFFGGLEILRWLGILPKDLGSYHELIEKKYTPKVFSKCDEYSVMNILKEVFYKDLEETLGYTFQNKALLLEAITHPTYTLNRITDCYQRLEFLGDAILDFLITSYIYQYCGEKTPGEVTDIRSALVNNITFASLSVRYGFQKYLLKLSARLNRAIEEFVSHQINQNHKIDDNEILHRGGLPEVRDRKNKVLILLEEDECNVTEAVQVPKVLGDIFESLAAAIFIDSGNSLETVWAVFYRLMKEQIDAFSKNPPKDPVRLLHEICKNRPRFEMTMLENSVEMKLSVRFESTEIRVCGIGKNKKEAKRSAAKFAVTKIADFLLKSQKK